MLNKIKKGLGLSLLFVISLCFASEHFLMPGVSIDFEFPPHSPQVLTNMFFWTLAANCRIISQDESNDIFVRMRASTGKVNGLFLKKGDELTITVHPNDILNLLANPGAQVELTNLGEHSVIGACIA